MTDEVRVPLAHTHRTRTDVSSSIPPPGTPAPRWSVAQLPPYRFVPGRFPHPRRDPRGHAVLVADSASAAEAFAYGIDLFNARYFWEAHEAWELVWRRAPRGTPEHLALKGLIQLAASLLTLHLGRPEASRRLAGRGIGLLEVASRGAPRFFGLDLARAAATAAARLLEVENNGDVDAAAFLLSPDDR